MKEILPSAKATIEIDGREIGAGRPCFVVAEIGQAHDGSLGMAHAYVDAVARAGADAVKFQTHIASAESTRLDTFRVKFSYQDANRYEYWKRMEFTEPQWKGLAEHARERNLVFLSSPFSEEAAALLSRVGMPAWKVGAGETANLPFLKTLADTGKPVLLSSGVSGWEDLDRAVSTVREAGADLAVYQCTTAYPCPAEKLGLNVLSQLRERYGCPVGLSDHSGVSAAGLAAVTLGANLLEVHVTFSRECFGPDVPASLTVDELGRLVEGARFIQRALANPVDKDGMAGDLSELRVLFGKSIVTSRALPRGHRITRGDLTLKKPGTGIPAARLSEVIGRALRQDVVPDQILEEQDLE